MPIFSIKAFSGFKYTIQFDKLLSIIKTADQKEILNQMNFREQMMDNNYYDQPEWMNELIIRIYGEDELRNINDVRCDRMEKERTKKIEWLEYLKAKQENLNKRLEGTGVKGKIDKLGRVLYGGDYGFWISHIEVEKRIKELEVKKKDIKN